MSGLRSLRFLVATAICWATTSMGFAATLALVPHSASDRELVDLLAVELSKHPGVELVERPQLRDLADESALLGRDTLARLQLGTAQGLVVVETFGEQEGRHARYRLVSVENGVALGWWTDQIQDGSREAWAKGAAQRITALAPKLSAGSDRLRAVSFVGFRSPTLSRESLSLERQINSLFLSRLGAAPELLTLERRRLLDAAFEKSASADDRAFWNAAALVEGTINPEGWTPGIVAVRWRIVRAGTTNFVESTVEGNSSNLLEIVERLTVQTRTELGLGAVQPGWNAPEEAWRFGEEASAAIRVGLWPEAIAAADTATALGLAPARSIRLRLAAYAGAIREPAEFGGGAQFYGIPGGALRAYGTALEADDIVTALETAHLLRDFQRRAADASIPDEPLAATVLETLGRFLLKAYLCAELRAGAERPLRELRGALRAFTADYIVASQPHREAQPDPFGTPANAPPGIAPSIPKALAKHGPLFYETPEDGLALQHWIHSFPASVEPLYGPPPDEAENRLSWWEWTPELCGWTWPARERSDKLWKDFQAMLALQIAAQRRLIALNRATNDVATENACQQAADFFLREEAVLVSGGFRTRFLQDFEDRWGSEILVLAGPVRARLETNWVSRLREVLGRIDRQTAEHAFVLGRPAYQFPSARRAERWRASLARRRFPTSREIGDWTAGVAMSPKEEQAQLLGALKLVLLLPEAATRTNDVAALRRLVSGLEMRTGVGTQPPWTQLEGLAAPRFPEVLASLRLFNVPEAPRIRPAGPDGHLRSRHFRCEPPLRFATVTGLRWGAGRLWVMGQGETADGETVFLSEFDPQTDRFIHHVVPAALVSGRPLVEPSRFAVGETKALIVLGENVVVLDRSTGRFTMVRSPLGNARVGQVGGRIFFHDSETLVESTEELARFDVVASTRRQPAVNDLDRQPSWLGLQLIENHPDGAWAIVNDRLFDLQRNGGTQVPWSDSHKTVENFPTGSLMKEGPESPRDNDHAHIWWFGANGKDPVLVGQGNRWNTRSLASKAGGDRTILLPHLEPEARLCLLGNRLITGPILFDGGKAAQVEVLIPGVWHPLTFWIRLGAEPGLAVEPLVGDDSLFFYPSFSGRPTGPGFFVVRAAELLQSAEPLIASVTAQAIQDRSALDTMLRSSAADVDGRLGPSGRAVLATEPNLLNLVWGQIDTNRNNALDLEEIGYFDFDQNGSIADQERDAFWNAVGLLARGFFAHLGGSTTNGPSLERTTILCQAMFGQMDCGRYDTNHDGQLVWPEWLPLFAEAQHRRLARVYLPALGLTPDDVRDAPVAETFLDPDLLMYLHRLKLQPRRPQ